MSRKKKKKGGAGAVFRSLVLLIALGVFCYAGWQLFGIFRVYYMSDREYSQLAGQFTSSKRTKPEAGETEKEPLSENGEGTEDYAELSARLLAQTGILKSLRGAGEGLSALSGALKSTAVRKAAEPRSTAYANTFRAPSRPDLEDAVPPITVDWNELKAINSDIVGWLYVEGDPSINYPICLAEDNDFYLHRTFEKKELFAGAIFADYHSAPDFSDPNTIVYGHNMKNGSMFGSLKNLASVYEEHPYFWILTPYANYRYHIYSIMNTSVRSDVYLLYSVHDEQYLAWEETLRAQSEAANSVSLYREDKTVILSTCTSDSEYRKVVIGKCVSLQRPVKRVIERPVRPEIREDLPDEDEYLDDDQ